VEGRVWRGGGRGVLVGGWEVVRWGYEKGGRRGASDRGGAFD